MARSLFTVPVAVLVLILVLGICKVSGSSVGALTETGSPSPLVGEPRLIRTDEYMTRTPLVVRQAELDFPARTDVGVGEHDTGVLSDLPAMVPSVIVKPHSWAYFVLDVERAFAIEWWLTILGPFLGIYAVLAAITRTRLIPSLGGLLATASPGLLWWAIPSSGLPVLYGGVLTAALIAAIRATTWRRYLYAALGGWAVMAFVALLYLPWLVPLGLMFGAIVAVQLPGTLRSWPAFLRVAGVFFATAAVLFALYYRDHHAALSAITNSRYPGDRVTPAGEAKAAQLLSAPYDVFATSRRLTTINGTNESQNSSGLMLWLPIALAGGAFSGWRSRSAAQRALAAVSTVAVIVAAWALLPIPSRLGSLLGLTNVQGERVALPLTIAGALAAGLYLFRYAEDPTFRPRRDRITIAAVMFAFVIGWAGAQLTIEGAPPSKASVVLLWAAATAVTALVLHGKVLLGLGGACLLMLFGSVRIHPLQVGLDPLTSNPFMAQVDTVRRDHETDRWAALGMDGTMRAVIAASGAPEMTGVSWYADPAWWERIDPTDASRAVWDRFATVGLDLDDSLPGPQIDLLVDDFIMIRTPSCAGALQALDVRFVASDHEVVSPCAQLIDAPDEPGERWIYDVAPPPP